LVESPDAGDDLIIECRNELTSSWMELDRQPSNDPDIYYYESRSVLLPQHMLKAGFKLRIRTVGNRWDWFIDDVMIKGQREVTTDSMEPVVVDDTDDRISETASFSDTGPDLECFPSNHPD